MQFESLPGFREFYPQACAERNHIFGLWRRVARVFSFQEYDAPILEPLDLYIEKSGEEIVGQLFNFEDKGGRAVALRPEMTPSLARLVGVKANSLKRPIKWFNIGEHYRYERPQKGRLRAFYQFNVDIFGEAGPSADAELISLLVESLRSFGLGSSDFRVRLSDRDLWLLLLSAVGLDKVSSQAVLGIVDKMERMDREKVVTKLVPILGSEAEAFFSRIEEVTAIRKFEELEQFILALPMDGDLREQAVARLNDWKILLDFLDASGVGECVQVDLGIVRGLAYYTGFVFEAFEATGQGRALAGGGRYDTLVKKLGGPDMPAVGFAMGDVTLADLLGSKKKLASYVDCPDFVMVVGGQAERKVAMADAAELRKLGHRVDYPLKEQSFGKQFKEANQKGARFLLIYGSDELMADTVKLRDFSSGNEAVVSRAQLMVYLGDILQNGLPSE